MYTLFLKEINSFLSSLIGYITIIVFLAVIGLFLWVFPMEFNVLDFGFAGIDGLFILAPWVFLFLIPAITMKMFAEEKKNGTIELLLTKPINDLSIILAKFFSSLTLLIIAILPTLIYVISVYYLGKPIGNIDLGSTFGSYIGLLFLGATFISIGIFISSLTSNQIVAFILTAPICFILHFGFEFIYSFESLGAFGYYLKTIGIDHHYAIISKGVIDSRDLIYFCSVIFIFLFSTRISLLSRKW